MRVSNPTLINAVLYVAENACMPVTPGQPFPEIRLYYILQPPFSTSNKSKTETIDLFSGKWEIQLKAS
jgi:hypothetical protein